MIRPRQFPFYPEHVPEELKVGRFWVCCDHNKIPQIPGAAPVRRASSTDPGTWRLYDEAASSFESGRHAGVGRVIAFEDDYVGADLDDIRDPRSRVITAEARSILESLDSYSEVSPSGTGVKVWIRARLDRSYVKPGLEIYCRGRYLVTTGAFLPQYPAAVEERQEEILSLVEREFPRPGRGCSAVTDAKHHGPRPDLSWYLDSVEVFAEVRDSLGRKFAIRCPWASEHSGDDESGSYVGQREDGGLWFRCWHAHCQDRSWREFKRVVRRKSRRRTISLKRGAITIKVEVNHD